MKLSRYSKSIVAFLGAAATWAAAALDDSHVTNGEWAGLAAAVLGVLAVYQVRNADPEPQDNADGFTVTELCLAIIAIVVLLWAFGVLPR